MRVVVVDDQEEIRMILRINLEFEGHEVVGEAANGQEAISMAEETQPDVMVLDIMMPVMNGLEAIPHIRRMSPATKILVCTAFSPTMLAVNDAAFKADGLVEKSAAPGQIALRVSALVPA